MIQIRLVEGQHERRGPDDAGGGLLEIPRDLECLEPRAVDDKQGWPIVKTSAKTGGGVEEAFERLTRAMLAG